MRPKSESDDRFEIQHENQQQSHPNKIAASKQPNPPLNAWCNDEKSPRGGKIHQERKRDDVPTCGVVTALPLERIFHERNPT